MSSSFQTIIALGVVLLAASLLLWSWLGKKKSGCAGACSAVSPELKKLQKQLKR